MTPRAFIETDAAVWARRPDGVVTVGQPPTTPRNRTQRVEADLHCGRTVTDTALLQHAKDCAFFMELEWERFRITHDPADKERARRWMNRMLHARQMLSPEWKAQREAQILADCGAGYFIDQGDKAREAANA